jgi:hypothetical protein
VAEGLLGSTVEFDLATQKQQQMRTSRSRCISFDGLRMAFWRPSMICKGVGGSIELKEDRLVFRRTKVLGLLFHGLKGEKVIPYSSITAVQFKRRGMTRGYIQFTLGGGKENTNGLLDATQDENSLLFDDNDTFEKAREFVELRIGSNAGRQQQTSPADALDKLASLVDKGLITREEFDEQKRKLFGQAANPATKLTEPKIKPPVEEVEAVPDWVKRAEEKIARTSTSTSQPSQKQAGGFGKRSSSLG